MWYVMSVDISVFGHLCCMFLLYVLMASIMGVYMFVCNIEFVCLLVRYVNIMYNFNITAYICTRPSLATDCSVSFIVT